MRYAIIGAGQIGQALAHAFARKNIDVAMANTRPPEAIAPLAKAIGPTIVPRSLEDALEADIVFLAVPFWSHRDVARAVERWNGKIVVDVTNAYGVPLEQLDGLPSSAVIARALPGARLVKGFNHLPAGVLAAEPSVEGGRRVIFLSSNDDAAIAAVAPVAEQLGYAPVDLGRLDEGGALVQARGNRWTQLIFQDLVKFD